MNCKIGIGGCLNLNNVIVILLVILILIVAGGIFFAFNNSNFNADKIDNNTTNSNAGIMANNSTNSNVNVEKVNTETVSSSESSSGSSGTHTVMGEDGCYYVVDDNGNILQSLGKSKKYYPNDPNSVNYPDAEPGGKYIHKS